MKQSLMRALPETKHHLRLAVMMFCVLAGAAGGFAQPAGKSGNGHVQADQALLDIRHNITLSRERADALEQDVAKLKKDQKSLSNALVETAKAERILGEDIRVREGRFKVLMAKKLVAEGELREHREEFAEVLAVVERMGLNPPPAMLVHADDALQSVRSAALLGAVMPTMRERMQTLAAKLKEVDGLTQSVENERMQLVHTVELQQAEKKRLSLLLTEKARLQKRSEEELAAERVHNEALIKRAQSLQELIAELERQSRLQTGGEEKTGTSRLTVQTDFSALHGRLPPPVDGRRVKAFGPSSKGESYETAPGAVVTSPVEGIVRYAGVFRSYGQLLIIDVGKNYHLILGGLGRIDVTQGQMLLQGEPVGVMDAQLVASARAFDIGKTAPMLYIEIRKDGKPVNPALWWARR